MKLNKSILLTFVFLLFFSFLGAQEDFLIQKKLPSGISENDLPQAIDSFFEEHKDTTAGVQVAVFTSDNILYQKNSGYSDIANHIRVSDQTVFEWGSATKMLVWVSLMQLCEAQKISLDDNVQKYLPENFFTKLKYSDPITIKNLMNHDAGFEDVIVNIFVTSENQICDLEEALRKTEPKQIFKPGDVVGYSNWGVALAGFIVQQVSGMNFFEYVHKNIFDPLNMTETALAPDLSDNEWVKGQRKLTKGYSQDAKSTVLSDFYIPLYPAGAATGTIRDFIKFGQSLISPNCVLFEKPETYAEFFSATQTFGETSLNRNCHGLWVEQFSVPVIGHGGKTAAMSSYLQLDIVNGYGTAVMTNQSQEQIYNCHMQEIVFGKFSDSEFAKSKESINLAQELSKMTFYASARTIKSGPYKIYGILDNLCIPPLTQKITEIPSIGSSIEFISDDVVSIISNNIYTYGVLQQNDQGNFKISVPYHDYLPISGFIFFFNYFVIILFISACVCVLCSLGAYFIRRILHLNELSQKGHVLCNTSILILCILVCIFLQLLFTYQPELNIKILLVLIDLVFVYQLFYFLRLCICLYKGKYSVHKTQKYAIKDLILLLVSLVFVAYYNLFIFL